MTINTKIKLAIFGDSFGVSRDEDEFDSWVTRLSHDYSVDNYCESGISQYKILQNICKVNLDCYDCVVITHTSPYRVYVPYNPLHQDTQYHKNCDIIFADIDQRLDKFSIACQQYFKYIFDIKYATDIHVMICKEIAQLCSHKKMLHITHFKNDNIYPFPELLNFHLLFLKNPGTVAHYNKKGNEQVYQTVKTHLNTLLS